ncbi:FAR1-related sequence 5-like protein [Tanacetum coccineum]
MSSVTVDNSSVNISLTTRIIASSSDHVPDDNSSSNISLTTSISAISSDSIDVSSDNVNDRPRVWVPDVEPSLKPSKGHIFVSIDQAYDFYKHYGKVRGFDIKLGKGKVNSVANGKGKFKVTNDGFSVKRMNDDASNVSKPDDGFSGTGPVRAFKLMKEMYGRFENVGVTATDCKNFRRDLNLFIGDRDVQMVVEKLENLEKQCEGFFMDYCQGECDSSNKYKMVFVPFIGIDNYNRSVTFGAGLLSDETIRSYKWLLQSFKKAFLANPQVIVTDQDPSMKQAIEVEFPNVRHRLCMWHIMQKLMTKIGSSVCNKSNFKEWFCRIVWNERISIDMFDHEWASIMDYFNLGEHKWLCDLYDMRHLWIPAFLRDEDMSGQMRTTLRSESENWYFNRFTNPDLTLLEKEVAELLTLNIFYEIQDEIVASIAKCLSVNVEQMGRFEKYYIRDTDVKKWEDSTQFEVYEVLYSSSDTIFTCSCRRYELYGLLCCHILYVLRMNNVNEFPREYMLDRWSKSDDNLWVDTSAFACDSTSSVGILTIRRIVEDTLDRLVPFKDKLDLYRLELSDLLAKEEAEVLVLMRVNKKDTFCSMLGVTEPERVVIKVPRHSTNKGTSSHKRWKNMEELIQNEGESSKKRRTSFVCGRAEGHNCRTCPYKAAINAAVTANKRMKCNTRSSALNYKE